MDLRPSSRQFISSLSTLFEKTENKSFHCSLRDYDFRPDSMSHQLTTLFEIAKTVNSLRDDKPEFIATRPRIFLEGFESLFKQISGATARN